MLQRHGEEQRKEIYYIAWDTSCKEAKKILCPHSAIFSHKHELDKELGAGDKWYA
jgi:hypothetical protein